MPGFFLFIYPCLVLNVYNFYQFKNLLEMFLSKVGIIKKLSITQI
jgi:hypothetical protein